MTGYLFLSAFYSNDDQSYLTQYVISSSLLAKPNRWIVFQANEGIGTIVMSGLARPLICKMLTNSISRPLTLRNQ